MSSDAEMDDSNQSETEIEPKLAIAPNVLTASKPGSAHPVHKGKYYDWGRHEDNYRAYTKPSIIWQLGDEYEREEIAIGSSIVVAESAGTTLY
jgi:hypothetical protein